MLLNFACVRESKVFPCFERAPVVSFPVVGRPQRRNELHTVCDKSYLPQAAFIPCVSVEEELKLVLCPGDDLDPQTKGPAVVGGMEELCLRASVV